MKRSFELRDSFSIAGWLFADLLLGLSMIFLVSNTQASDPSPTPGITHTATATSTFTQTWTPTATETVSALVATTPSPTSTPTPTSTASTTATFTRTPVPTKTATPTQVPPAMLIQEPVVVIVKVTPDLLFASNDAVRAEEESSAKKQIQALFAEYEDVQRAGIVLSFGMSDKPSEGNRLALAMNELLGETLPIVFVSGARGTVFRDFHFITADAERRGWVEIEVYFLSSE